MNLNLDGVCDGCHDPVPISENTVLPEGLFCAECRDDGVPWRPAREAEAKRAFFAKILRRSLN